MININEGSGRVSFDRLCLYLKEGLIIASSDRSLWTAPDSNEGLGQALSDLSTVLSSF